MAYALKTDDSASRKVIVKNLSPITKQEDIIIHFQRRGNGGGEVDSVHMLNERAAIVTFEKSTVAESVLKRLHEIHGSLVTVELYRPLPDQVFGRVSGRINPNTLNASNHSMKTILQQIQDETKVEWKEIFDGFVVSGTFDQLKAVNELVKNKLTEKNHGKNVFSPSLSRHVSSCDKASPAPPVMTPSTETFRKTRDQSYETTSTSSSQVDNQSSANELMPETQVIDGCVQSSQLSLNPDDVLQSVLEKYHSNEPQTFKKVKTDASDKYSTLNGIPTSETVTDSGVVFSDANVPMKKTAKKTQREEKTKEHCRLTTSATSSEQIKGKKDASITLQLDYEIAEEGKNYACDLQAKAEEFHAIKTENESDSTPPVGMDENAKQSQNLERNTTSNVISNTNQELGVTGKGTYMFDTGTGLRVWLTKGDITSQQDDILLSPIDPSLSLKSDFLKRIFRKGGAAIKQEYLHKKESHAHPHDPVITGGGNLACRAIVFAVLPLWNNEVQDKKKRKQQIHRRLKEAITRASGCGHKSMALPLLRQDGNDIQDSAEIIVRVIASFGKNIDPMHSGINEFRIVCKDEASLAVLLNEFSSFSFHPGQQFFVNRSSSINNLVQAEETDVTLASQNSQRNKPEMHDLSSEKVSSMDPDKETSSRNEASTNKNTVDHIDEPQAPSKSSEVTVGKEKGPPLPSISPSCPVDSASHQNHIDWDTKHEAEEDGSSSDVKHDKELTIGNVPSSCGRYTTSHVASNGNHQRGIITDTVFRKFDTVTGLKVVLVKGDITSQKIDVLVSPIDSSFSFKSDLLKRILEEGGEAIKREYLSIKGTNAPSQDPVIIDGGDLPCRALLFAVLPQWNNEIEDKQKCKKQIHRRLKEAIMLASGYRHKSVALPLLGQDYNDIPVEVSAEVIVCVIASFGKKLGPMHSGINEFRIVCEDEASFSAVVNQITSFSFPSGGQPFFVSRSSNSINLAHAEETARNEASIDKMSVTKVISVNQDQEAPRITEFCPKENTVDQVDEVHVVSQASASKSSEVTGEKEAVPSGYPSSFIHSSRQCHSNSHPNHESKEDGTLNDEKQVNEMTICHVPSSSVDCVEISVTRASEILQVTSVTQRVQEKIKSNTLQDQPHLDFVADHALNLREKEMSTGISKIEEITVGTAVTQEVTMVDGDPQLKSSLPGRNQGVRTQETENNRSLSSTKFKDINIMDAKIQALDENSQEESASSFHIQPKVPKKSTVLYKKVNQTEEGNNSGEKNRSKKGKTVYSPSRPIPGIGDKELKEKGDLVWKDECFERKKGDQKLNGEVPDRELNEQQVPILCALCQDSVDHPELTDLNTCMTHKFCDDCIIKAFTFSNICPACLDTVGLITSKKQKVSQNQDLAHSSIKGSSYHLNKVDKRCLPATANSFPANQPPGEIIWKKYQTSLPGFEGHDTIAVKFTFYDGVQGLDHPNPGMPFKGTQCIAYLPETSEGKEVLKLLRKAFAACLLFTISCSSPEGIGNVSVNDIELKTSLERHSRNSYPDDGYLTRVRNQLAAKGFH